MTKTASESRDLKEFHSGIFEDHRPWGKFRSFPYENAGSIKIITVKPGKSLSLQYHAFRSEFWIILDEGLEVTVGDRVWRPAPNEEIYIPRRARHRMRSVGDRETRVLEILIGHSAETDIVRLEDEYGRS
ncbi:MAG: phosphomannose isomerase type II C-terminal cupin domain [Candidatus Aminicenantes bacterium]|nr:phosphomannose isomerase type II C-terminal cupin domain [Candidatus Aminicenantes bacterium]